MQVDRILSFPFLAGLFDFNGEFILEVVISLTLSEVLIIF